MKVTYTKEQLLAKARMLLGFAHSRADCGATQTDGVDVDAIILETLRNWYLNLLRFGTPSMLAPQEIQALTSLPSGTAGGSMITLPQECVRVLSVRLPGWHHSVEAESSERMNDVVSLQLNPYTQSTADTPVAVIDASRKIIYAWPQAAEYGNLSILAAVDNGEDSYTFDDSALTTLPEALEKVKIIDYGTF